MQPFTTDAYFWGVSSSFQTSLFPGPSVAQPSSMTVAQSRLTLFNPLDCSPPGSSVHGILQARIWEWVAISYSRGSSQPRDQTSVSCNSCLGRWILYQLRLLGSPQRRGDDDIPKVTGHSDWPILSF